MASHAVSPLTGGLLRRGVPLHHSRRLLAVAAVIPEAPAPTPAPSQPSSPPPSPAPPRKGYFPKRGETVELTCESLAFKGKGRLQGRGLHLRAALRRALPASASVARVRRLRRGSFAEAAKLRTLEPHHDAVEAPCPLAADCGGCKTQALAYAAQVRHKYLQVRDLLVNVGKFDPKRLESSEPDATLKPIVPCDEIFRYRNKVRFWVAKVFDGFGCADCNALFGFLFPFPRWSSRLGTKRWMQKEWKEKKEVVKEEANEADGYALGLHAPGFFDKVLHVEKCFLQSEPADKADVLYKLIEDSAGLKGDGSEIVLDLFCGTGTIGLTLARRAKHVYGYEVVPEAIADARKNAKLNIIDNATFVQGDLNKINESFGKEFPKPDIIISDPNRPGMHMKLIKWLLEVKAPRIVYVSCNPATCARDLDYLCHGVEEKDLRGCYELKSVIPVDMFPHTPHIECVCLLELR
ncbi:unnamed protein product [Urochloa decumbens]|uniref:Uncharacterized protein n=1 Tax=Urochloa decumbens TaxID=240449 RepID=A0ABC8ZSV7_9POAL